MLSRIHQFSQTSSTQVDARRLIAEGLATQGDLVVADEQQAGRGRFGRTWISPRGGLYATLILAPDPLLPLKAGLAIVNALGSAGIEAGLKWPNDVLIDNLKIAGVLVEIADEHALVGIGLNLTTAPLDTATCLARYVDCLDRDTWAQRILAALRAMSHETSVLKAYRDACLTLGLPVRVEGFSDMGSLEGIARDVDEQGRLVVETPDGDRVVSSGECFHLRETPSR